MNQWHFVIAAYALSIPVLAWVVIASFVAMRRAEKAVDELKRGTS
jgi:heme exporter protein CcmD